MAITTSTDGNGTSVWVGKHLLACITLETDDTATTKFVALCQEHEAELMAIGIEYEAKRDWNFNNSGQGKLWPIFNKRDRIVSKLCREAGIIDS